MGIKIHAENGANVQVTDKQIVNNIVYGDVVQRKEVSLPTSKQDSKKDGDNKLYKILDRVESKRPVCWREVTSEYTDFSILQDIIRICSTQNIAEYVISDVLKQKESDFEYSLRKQLGDRFSPNWKSDPEQAGPIWDLSDELRIMLESRHDYIRVKDKENTIDKTLSSSHSKIIESLLALVDKGDWKKVDTAERVKLMLKTILGLGDEELTEEYKEMSMKLWGLLESGRGDREKIVWQNMVGYFDDKKLFNPKGSPALNKDFFGDEETYSNIDKGRPSRENMSSGFREVLPLLDKYCPDE